MSAETSPQLDGLGNPAEFVDPKTPRSPVAITAEPSSAMKPKPGVQWFEADVPRSICPKVTLPGVTSQKVTVFRRINGEIEAINCQVNKGANGAISIVILHVAQQTKFLFRVEA